MPVGEFDFWEFRNLRSCSQLSINASLKSDSPSCDPIPLPNGLTVWTKPILSTKPVLTEAPAENKAILDLKGRYKH